MSSDYPFSLQHADNCIFVDLERVQEEMSSGKSESVDRDRSAHSNQFKLNQSESQAEQAPLDSPTHSEDE